MENVLKRKVGKINAIIQRFQRNIIPFGLRISFWIAMEELFSVNRVHNTFAQKILLKKHSVIESYLENKYEDMFTQYKSVNSTNNYNNKNNSIIWFFWGQGYEQMPEVVKTCYQSIVRNANGRAVHFIDLDNYTRYVTIPDYIITKFSDKKITFTHLSDVLRMALLSKYGGLWIDSTVYVTSPIPIDYSHYAFFTTKMEPREMTCISNARWNIQIMGGHSTLFQYIYAFWCQYWKENDLLIDYFLTDYTIDMALKLFPFFRTEFDEVPNNNTTVYDMDLVSDNSFDSNTCNRIMKKTIFYKLNWRKQYRIKSSDGLMTNYGFLIMTNGNVQL